MRKSDVEWLGIRFPLQLLPVARGGAQYRIDDPALVFRSQLNRFMHRGMFSYFGDEELIQTEVKNIAKIDTYPRRTKDTDPKVEQR
jgi:hypothetical protein